MNGTLNMKTADETGGNESWNQNIVKIWRHINGERGLVLDGTEYKPRHGW